MLNKELNFTGLVDDNGKKIYVGDILTPKNMKKFKIPVSWSCYAIAEVDAESLEEAIDLVSSPEFPLPTDWGYIEDTFKVDREFIDELYE